MSAYALLNLLSELGGGGSGGDKMRGSYRFHQRALIKTEMQDFTYYVCMSLK